METPPKPDKRKLHGFLCVVAILLIVFILISNLSVGPRVLNAAKRAKLGNEIIQVQDAVRSFDAEYNFYPVAPDNAMFIKILTGATHEENRRGIAFLTVKPSDLNAKGELLDPWGTPLELSISMSGNIHVRSAGPDKIFDTADDKSGDANLSGEY